MPFPYEWPQIKNEMSQHIIDGDVTTYPMGPPQHARRREG